MADFRKKLKAAKPKEPASDAALSAGKKPAADAAAKLSGRVLDEEKAGAEAKRPIDPAEMAVAPADAPAEMSVSPAPVDVPEPRAQEPKAESPTMESPLFSGPYAAAAEEAAIKDEEFFSGIESAAPAVGAGEPQAEDAVPEVEPAAPPAEVEEPDASAEAQQPQAEFRQLLTMCREDGQEPDAPAPQPQEVPSLADVVDVQAPDEAALGPITVIQGTAAFSKIGETHPTASGYQLSFMGMADANACNFLLNGKEMKPVILNPGESKVESVEIEGGTKMTVKLTYRKEVNAEGNKEVEYEAITEMGAMTHALATKKAVGAAARSGWKGFMRHWQEILTGISGIAIAAAGIIAQSQTIKAHLGSLEGMYNYAFAAVGAAILAGAVAVGVLRGREKQD